MKIVYNSLIPFGDFAAINLFGVLFVRRGKVMTEKMLNHERIHTVQMKEMLYVPFYVWYFVEWLMEVFRYGRGAYATNTFEREAHANDDNLNYLNERKPYAWWDYR